MAKFNQKSNPLVEKLFDELEKYLTFCQDFGYRFNEVDLYNFRSYSWQQYSKYSQGKNAKDMWEQDSQRHAARRV
jgi:hypothetical protein